MKAREKSSILRQVGPSDFGVAERENSSSSNVSSRSSVSTDYLNCRERLRDNSLGSVKVGPLPVYFTRDDSDTQYESPPVQIQIRTSCSSPSHIVTDFTSLSPLPSERRYGLSLPISGLPLSASLSRTATETSTPVGMGSRIRTEVPAHQVTVLSRTSADFSRAWSGPAYASDGYEASGGESADDGVVPKINHLPLRTILPDENALFPKEETDLLLGGPSEGHHLRTPDRGKGFNRAHSMLSSTSYSKSALPKSSASYFSFYNDPRPKFYPESFSLSQIYSAPDASSTVLNIPFTLDNLVYSGTSIFYGGPFAEPPVPMMPPIQRDAPQHPIGPGLNSVKPAAHLDIKRSPPHALLRLQSPVFAPSGISFSIVGP